jgi:spermidine synthase
MTLYLLPMAALVKRSSIHFARVAALLSALVVVASPGCGRSGEYVVTERESNGYSVFVIEDEQGVRKLRFARDGIDQSAIVPGDPDQLVFAYMKGMMAGFALQRDPERVLLIGLGGGTFPMFVRRHLPDASIDVVEIDPVVVEVASGHLGFREDERMVVHVADGRRFVEEGEPGRRWDLIALDAYGPEMIPEHLATRQFYEAVRARLAPGGVLVANLWSEYANARYLSMLRTLEDVFAEVHVVAPPKSESRLVFAFREAVGLSREQFVERSVALKKAWRLRFDLPQMVFRGYAGPDALPPGGAVLLDAP